MRTPKGFQAVIDHFQKNGWNFQVMEACPMLSANFVGQNGTYRLMVAVDETDDLVQVFGFVPLVVPPHRLAAVSELCIRLSRNLKIGRFELNHADGEVRFQTYGAYPLGELNERVLQRVFGLNLAMTDLHFPAFIEVIYTDATPDQAAKDIRARTTQSQATGPAGVVAMPARFKLN